MTYNKKNFNVDDRVVIVATNGILDGMTGSVLAKMATPSITDDYIVAYDLPVNGQKALVITEACLEAV
jgi:hypothetical protein